MPSQDMGFSEVIQDVPQGYRLSLPGGVRVTASSDPDAPLLRRFLEGYDRAFILPDEREELDGFQKCLALNSSHRNAFGRVHAEFVAVLEDEAGTLLGGTDPLATPLGQLPASPAVGNVILAATEVMMISALVAFAVLLGMVVRNIWSRKEGI